MIPAALAAELPQGFRLEPVVGGLTNPWSVAGTPDGRILIAERTTGKLQSTRLGVLLPGALCELSVDASDDGGLLGVAVHPGFRNNGWVYLYYTDLASGNNKVTRYTIQGNTCTSPFDIISNLGAGSLLLNNGGGMGFGPDGKLYVATGDMDVSANAQDPDVMQGKVLRLNDDGTIPGDNPNPASAVYAVGLRDGRGLSVNPDGAVYVTDRGDSSFVHDELNHVAAGGNLGWDVEDGMGGIYDEPLAAEIPSVAIHGVAVYDGTRFPDGASDGSDSDHDKWGPDHFAGVARADDNSLGFCIGSAKNGLGCSTDANCLPVRVGESTHYCEKRDDAAEYCPAGSPVGDDTCGDAGAAGVDEPDESFPLNVFAASGGTIQRAVLVPGSSDSLHQWETFMDSVAAGYTGCPTGWTDVMSGSDGHLYAVATNGGGAGAGKLYRIVHDDDPRPREVSPAGSYFPLRVDKTALDNRVEVFWEDLRDDAKQPRQNGVLPAPPDREYTVWRGNLGDWDSHTPAAGLGATPGDFVNDAYRRKLVGVTPANSYYFLVSGRGSNLEGTLGYGTPGERIGYAATDLCPAKGYHEFPTWDLHLCGQDFTLVDAHQQVRSLSEFRGQVVFMDFSAFWCAPCYVEAEQLEDLWEDYEERGVQMLSVVMDEESISNDWNGRPKSAECRVWEQRNPLCIDVSPPGPANNYCTAGLGPCTTSADCPDPKDHTFECWADEITCSGEPCSGGISQEAWPNFNAHSALPTNVILDTGFQVVFTTAGYSDGQARAYLDLIVESEGQCLH
jgi:hypothetical protein